MANLFKRLGNLWRLSNFEITLFDNKLVITEKNGTLEVAHPTQPKMAQIIRRKSPVKEFLKNE